MPAVPVTASPAAKVLKGSGGRTKPEIDVDAVAQPTPADIGIDVRTTIRMLSVAVAPKISAVSAVLPRTAFAAPGTTVYAAQCRYKHLDDGLTDNAPKSHFRADSS